MRAATSPTPGRGYPRAMTTGTASGSTAKRTIDVETPHGTGRWFVDAPADPAAARALLVLGHGAGGGSDARDLAALARELPALGVAVARFDQPWRVAGKRVAARPVALDEAWLDAAPGIRALAGVAASAPLVLGGRSAGARVACRTAPPLGAAGVVCLAFPLHPPGRPERSRVDELAAAGAPTLVLQGDRDTFGSGDEVRAALRESVGAVARIRVIDVPGADHGMKTLKRGRISVEEVDDLIVREVATFIAELLG